MCDIVRFPIQKKKKMKKQNVEGHQKVNRAIRMYAR